MGENERKWVKIMKMGENGRKRAKRSGKIKQGSKAAIGVRGAILGS